eukprot:21325-Heterococcus_DN1.PRE.5
MQQCVKGGRRGQQCYIPTHSAAEYAYNSSVVQDLLSEIIVMHAVQHKVYTRPYNYPAFMIMYLEVPSPRSHNSFSASFAYHCCFSHTWSGTQLLNGEAVSPGLRVKLAALGKRTSVSPDAIASLACSPRRSAPLLARNTPCVNFGAAIFAAAAQASNCASRCVVVSPAGAAAVLVTPEGLVGVVNASAHASVTISKIST